MAKIEIESKTIEKALGLAADFIKTIIGPSIEEVGGLFGDNWRALRIKNELRLIQNTENYIKRNNIIIKKIPLKILAPLLNGAAMEEEETLQDKWVALFVNYIDSSKSFRSTVFPYILTQISTDEAKALEYIEDNKVVKSSSIFEKFNLSDSELSNLDRLGLIKENLKIKSDTKMGYLDQTDIDIYVDDRNPEYYTSQIGKEFLKACKLKENI